jgi:pimeloyl-ACP methyl ester carboxylesterase
LNVGYAEAGPADGPVVLLLHGWPYDIYSFVDVAPLLASAGYRVIVPYLRGYGSTRFLSRETFRNGQQSVVAVDIVAARKQARRHCRQPPSCNGGTNTISPRNAAGRATTNTGTTFRSLFGSWRRRSRGTCSFAGKVLCHRLA